MIKFRAYLKKHERIVDAVEIDYRCNCIIWIDEHKYTEIEDFEDIILLQSTGLKDVHEVEFFDKDIAKDIDSEELGLVEYVNGAFVMKFAGGDGVDLYDVKDNFEIIGNQFKHPNLLEE